MFNNSLQKGTNNVRRAFLHIGAGKAGSTSLQRSFFLSKAQNDKKLFFPTLLNYKNNQIFRFAFCDARDTPSDIKGKYANNKSAYAQFQQEIKDDLQKQCVNKQNIFISSEFLFLANRDEVLNIKQYLNGIGINEIHVLVFLRSPEKYYLSVAQQALKNGPNIPHPDRFRYDISGAIESWSAINPASLTLREFDRGLLINGDIISDVESYFKSKKLDIELKKIKAANVTMTVEASVLLEELQQQWSQQNLSEEQHKKKMHLARIFSKAVFEGTKPVLKEEVANRIKQKYRATLLSSFEKFGVFETQANQNLDVSYSELPKNLSFADLVATFDTSRYQTIKEQSMRIFDN